PTCSRWPPAPPHRPGQARGELTDPFRRGGERAGLRDLPVLPDRYLPEITVHIQPDTPPLCPAHPLPLLPQMRSDRERVSKATPTDPRAQRNRAGRDRKSTRLNSSHLGISYAVFC